MSRITPNTFIPDSGTTCNMCGSIGGMFNLKPHDTNNMVGNNETMYTVSKGNNKDLVMKKMANTLKSLYKMSYTYQNLWSIYSL
jgi:hypothetical protein